MNPLCRPWALLLSGLLLPLGVPSSDAQTSARRPVRAGAVTGVEMQIEGAMNVTRGGALSFAVTAYDVLGLDVLRPSPHATIRALSSLAPAEAAAEVEADRNGRALIRIPVPDDAPGSFRIVLELRSRARALRRFELGIHVMPALRLSLHAAPASARPGDSIVLLGRLEGVRDGRGVAGREVRISLRDGRGALGPDVSLQTNAFGLFELSTLVPEEVEGGLVINATTVGDNNVGAPQLNVPVEAAPTPVLLVFAQPATAIAAPGAHVGVHVLVRRPDGRPLAGVQVRMRASERQRDLEARRTDERGRVELVWSAPSRFHGARQVSIQISASRAGFGSVNAQASLLLTDQVLGARVSFEGGTLSPELGGEALVRVGRSDGEPAAGLPVRMRLANGRDIEGTTDAEGLALLRLPRGLRTGDGSQGCGGGSATKVTLELGTPAAYTHDLCVPLDPDAVSVTRLEDYLLEPGQELSLRLRRTRAARRLPLVVTAFRMGQASLHPFATQVLPAGTNQARITLPTDYVGDVLIRTRALFGARHEELRGSSVMARVAAPATPAHLGSVAPERGGLQFSVEAPEGQFGRLSVLPLAQARALFETLGGERAATHGELFVRAELAEHTPRDRTAPAVLRGGRAVAMPSVNAPDTEGVLRDPWRARARFTRGRLALIFRALESRLAESIPGDIERVAVRERGRLRLNERVLESLSGGGNLGAEGATGLGGEPLRLSTLKRLDRDFDYDAVARRLTRRRLFRVLIGLRQFVRARDFDLPWARLGEPELWLRNMADEGMELPRGDMLEARQFVDGWGRAFALMRSTRGGSLAPVPGYAVVSAGPDGRFGTGDDLSDPMVRVLRSGGLYAEAVGEEALLARLSGVEIARATLRSVAGLFEMEQPQVMTEDTSSEMRTDYGSLPLVAKPDAFALALVRPRDSWGVIAQQSFRLEGHERSMSIDPGAAPRPVGAVLEVFGPNGERRVQLAEAFAGGDLLADAVLPTRLRVQEPVRARVHLTNLGNQALDVHASLDAEHVRAEAPEELRIPAGESRELTLRLEADELGDASLSLSLDAGQRALRVSHRLQVLSAELPLQIAATRVVGPEGLEFILEPPLDARDVRARLVLLSPRAIWRDPAVARLARKFPGLYAFSMTMSGQIPGPELRAALLRSQQGGGMAGGLETATSLVAVAGLLDDDEARSAARHMSDRLLGAQQSLAGAATVAALVTRGLLASAAEENAGDPLSRALASTLPALRRVLRDRPEDWPAMARASAALLLADPSDLHGLSMLERVRGQLLVSGAGQLVEVEPNAGRAEQAAATFALSLAAWQADDRELAASLVRGAMPYQDALLGGTEEQVFWLLASAGYGAMGDPGESVVRARIDGDAHEASLTDGVLSLDVPARAGRPMRVELESDAALLTRLEASYARAPEAREGPLTLGLRGDSASLDTRALFELSVEASRAIAQPVVEFSLPAGAELDDRLRQDLVSNAAVASVQLREGGIVRLGLRPIAAGQRVTIPLPLRFIVTGTQRGLALLTFPSDEPRALSVLPARAIRVSETDDAN